MADQDVTQAAVIGECMSLARIYDVVVIGGGAAGLSAAVTLCRSLRSVLVIDAGEPRNGRSSGVHGFLSREGLPPEELLAAGRAEVRVHGGEILRGRAVSAREEGGVLVTELQNRQSFRSRRLLICSGFEDELPKVPGVRERWGQDVLHCPYCHGWEVSHRDQHRSRRRGHPAGSRSRQAGSLCRLTYFSPARSSAWSCSTWAWRMRSMNSVSFRMSRLYFSGSFLSSCSSWTSFSKIRSRSAMSVS